MNGMAFYIDSLFDEHLGESPTPPGDIPVTGIAVVGDSSPIGLTSKYTVSYSPASTTQKGVVWSIQSGGQYATINQSGIISILEGSDKSSVTIRATSVAVSSLYGEKEITVTYNAEAVSAQIQEYCERVISDGGALFKVSQAATQAEYNRHKLLLGVNPRMDFLGYKIDGNNLITKLYSVDSVFDCDSIENIKLENGIITPNTSTGKILWNSNLVTSGITDMTHLCYEGTVVQLSSADSIFIANLLKTSYYPNNLMRQAIFYQGGMINVQYAAFNRETVNAFPVSASDASALSLNLTIDGNANGESYKYVTAIDMNGKNVLSQKVSGADFWGRAIDTVSYIKVYQGFKFCIAG